MSVEQWSDLLFSEAGPRDGHAYGSVRAVNEDGSYMVQLNASSTLTRCAPFCTAMVGDRVKVVINANGKCDAIGRLGGEIGGGGEVVMTVNDASNYVAGKVFAHAGTNDPAGALLCDGRAVSRREYWELFDAIGTTYGAGDGSSTFNLPNIESRTIIGEGDSYALGATGGEEEHTLTEAELPYLRGRAWFRNWTWGSGSQGSVFLSPDGIMEAEPGGTTGYDMLSYGSAQGGSNILKVEFGGDQPHNNMQPYIVMRYFITTGKGDPVSGINPADYVVEWNANDNGWYWEKWASGKAECGIFLENYVLDSTYDDLYYTHTTVNLPFEFKTVKNVQATGQDENNLIDASVSNITTASVRVYISAPVANITDGCVSLKVTGTWKDSPASGGTETIAPTIAERFEGIESDVAELLENPENKVLWSGAHYMTASQTATLSEAISKQKHGVILVFSGYDPSTSSADNYGWNFHPVPKSHVAKHNGAGCVFNNWNSSGNWLCINYIYVHDTKLTGSAQNGTGETSLGGSDTLRDNSGHVLRYVIGY